MRALPQAGSRMPRVIGTEPMQTIQHGIQTVDGNGDGVAECYYFDGNGYILANTTTPDGYQVNAGGAWIQNGAVKTKSVGVGKDVVSSNAETTTNADIPDFTGEWYNVSGKYIYYIEKMSDGTYKMLSEEHRSAWETAGGQYTGQYDAQTKILTFIGRVQTACFGYLDDSSYSFVYYKDNQEPVISYADDVMRFKMGDSGMLQIMDTYSNAWEDWLKKD